MNPVVSRITNNQAWVLPVSALSLVLGFMIVTVSMSGSPLRTSRLDADQRDRLNALNMSAVSEQQQQQIKEQSVEINNLRGQVTQLQNNLGEERSEATRLLNKSLQDVKAFAGLTQLEGPGIVVTLSDANDSDKQDAKPDASGLESDIPDQEKIIHDQDILRVVNELNASGAEAISVNNLRLVGTSSIRCVGPTVLIDAERVASPFKVRAIGNPDTLSGGLKIPGGVYDQLKEVDPRMVSIEEVKDMTLPAYSGPTSNSYAKVVDSSK